MKTKLELLKENLFLKLEVDELKAKMKKKDAKEIQITLTYNQLKRTREIMDRLCGVYRVHIEVDGEKEEHSFYERAYKLVHMFDDKYKSYQNKCRDFSNKHK